MRGFSCSKDMMAQNFLGVVCHPNRPTDTSYSLRMQKFQPLQRYEGRPRSLAVSPLIECTWLFCTILQKWLVTCQNMQYCPLHEHFTPCCMAYLNFVKSLSSENGLLCYIVYVILCLAVLIELWLDRHTDRHTAMAYAVYCTSMALHGIVSVPLLSSTSLLNVLILLLFAASISMLSQWKMYLKMFVHKTSLIL